jgi:hypothetical protein
MASTTSAAACSDIMSSLKSCRLTPGRACAAASTAARWGAAISGPQTMCMRGRSFGRQAGQAAQRGVHQRVAVFTAARGDQHQRSCAATPSCWRISRAVRRPGSRAM